MLEFIERVWRRRKFIFYFNLAVLILVIAYAFTAPKWYMSKLTFLVEPEESSMPLTLIMVETPFRLSGEMRSETDRYLAMLYSHTIVDRIISKYDLARVYSTDIRDELYEKFRDNVIVRDNMDNTITVLCYYKGNSVKAADMVNDIFHNLKNLDENLNRKKAREFKSYMEENFDRARNELTLAEDELRVYKSKEGIIALDEQIKKIVDKMSTLEAEKISFEISRDYLQKVVGPNYPKLMELSKRIQTISEKIQTVSRDSLYATLIFGEIPDRSVEYARLVREMTLREKVVEYLVTQVEQAKIDERKITTNLLLLEEGVPAEKHARPRRLQIITITSFFAFFLSLLIVPALELYEIRKEELKRIFRC